MSFEIYRHLYLGPHLLRSRYHELPDLSRQIEAAGWDGVAPGEGVCNQPDPYVTMTVIACSTEKLLITHAIAHPMGRHSSVTAAGAHGLQLASRGRASITIGKGDGGVISLGMRPATVAAFERYVAEIQGFLRGEVVDLDGFGAQFAYVPTDEVPKVPVSVAATGPKMIGVGARLAERITFSVGAEPERVKWAVETARAVRDLAGLDPGTLSLGCYVIMSPSDAPSESTMQRLRTLASVHIRFGAYDERSRVSGSEGRPLDTMGLSGQDRDVLGSIVQRYDNDAHAHIGSPQAAAIPESYLRRFAVVGSPERCAERLGELASLGLDHFVILAGLSIESSPEEIEAEYVPIAETVLPAFRAALAR
jgi:5,10-methylenetetrahydromethanopterin reductase